MNKKENKKKWYDEGIRFSCQGSGNCCVSHGEYGFVYLDKDDRKQMANLLGLTISAFTRKYCQKSDGYYHLKSPKDSPDCIFLDNNKCSVYEARPMQCRTWPFWPDVLDAKTWKKDVAAFCPGVGKGRLFKREEIEKIADQQTQSELSMEKK